MNQLYYGDNLEILRKQVENMAVVLTNVAIHQQLAQQGKMFDVAEGLRIWLKLYPELEQVLAAKVRSKTTYRFGPKQSGETEEED